MEGVFLFLLLVVVLGIIFLLRVWRFMKRHPVVALVDDVAFKVDVFEEGALGEVDKARTVHVRIQRTQ